MTPNGVDADLGRLESGIRQLKVQYDMFFAGALGCEPVELRRKLEKIIADYTRKPLNKYAHRFRFNALVSRYNCFSELWGKTVRRKEEGDHRPAGVGERLGLREHLLTRCRVGGPATDQDELKRLHRRYVEAARSRGGAKVPSLQAFTRSIAAQTEKLRKKNGCGQIELRLVIRDDQVHLKARPGK